MTISAGDKLGPYEILATIGAGGMGEVWKARDTRLDRTVAIKFSKGEFSERFEREARAVAALNHPGICHLYDVGPNYLVMEYIEGAALKGPLPIDEALRIAIQIAEALDVAHRKGIIHRDLKPSNVLVTKTGVKLLDFGLAKFQGAVAADQQTVTMSLTAKGQILGTLHYMSPEQIQGQETDARSDVFSFGLVLYEMLTGRYAFRAENAASIIAAILKEQPAPIEQVVPFSPPALGRLLSRTLDKDPERRWQSMRDVMLELASILAALRDTPPAPSRVRTRFSWMVTALAVLITLVACIIGFGWIQDIPDATVGKLSLLPVSFEPEIEVSPIFSPDGKSLVYSRGIRGTRQLFVRSFNVPSAARITECSLSCDPIAWSADGARIYFVEGADLLVTASSGGSPQVVMKSVNDTTGFVKPIALSPDGRTLLFARPGPDGKSEILASSPPGADPKPLQNLPPGSGIPFCLRFSPNGRKIAASFVDVIVVAPFPTGKSRTLENIGDSTVSWMPDSRHIIYCRRSSNEVVLRDTESLDAHSILRSENIVLQTDVSPDGTRLAYESGIAGSGIVELLIDSGAVHPLRVTRIPEYSAAYSPSGDRYIYVSFATGRGEIMLRDITGSGATQLTFGNPVASDNMFQTRSNPVFSPDGRRIVFSQSGQIWAMPATGGQPAPITAAPEERVVAPAWSPDGRWLAYQRGLPGNRELVKIDSAGQGQVIVLAHGLSANTVSVFTRWSTAGGHLAYLGKDGVRICAEDGSGDRLLVSSGSPLPTAGPRVAVAGDFNRSGDLFYALKRVDGKWTLLTVEVSSARVLRTIVVEESPEVGIRAATLNPDGKRMIFSRNELDYDIWMLDGLPRPETGWMRIFRHWAP